MSDSKKSVHLGWASNALEATNGSPVEMEQKIPISENLEVLPTAHWGCGACATVSGAEERRLLAALLQDDPGTLGCLRCCGRRRLHTSSTSPQPRDRIGARRRQPGDYPQATQLQAHLNHTALRGAQQWSSRYRATRSPVTRALPKS